MHLSALWFMEAVYPQGCRPVMVAQKGLDEFSGLAPFLSRKYACIKLSFIISTIYYVVLLVDVHNNNNYINNYYSRFDFFFYLNIVPGLVITRSCCRTEK